MLAGLVEEAGVGGGDGPGEVVVADEGEFVDGAAAVCGLFAGDGGGLIDEAAAEDYDAVVFFYVC